MSPSSPMPSASQKASAAATKPKPETSLLSKSAEGATLLIALQIGSRALTFVVGQLLLRFLFPPELFGISTQLEVYSISVLFFARESLRVAIQRQTNDPEPRKSSTQEKGKDDDPIPEGHVDGRTAAGKTQAIVNLAYVSMYLGAIFAVILAWLYLRTVAGTPEILNTPYFQEALKLYGFAAAWELLAEPCFVVAQHRSMYKIRAAAEAIATLLRCLATCASAVWASRNGHDLGVMPFAIGQATYAISLAIVYYCCVQGIATSGGFNLSLTPIYSSDASAYIMSYFSKPLLILGTSLFVQLLVKHVLTQGDTILIATFASPVAQGTYALANNYGGLLARLVLQPVEESSRNYFGKLLATVDGKPPKDLVMKARSSLLSLLRAYVLLSVCVLAVGPTIAPLLLKVIAGSKWAMSGAGDVLATYCYYIPLLAINGVTEAFVSSVATESEVNRQSVWMLAFSVGFGGSAYIFLRVLELGAEGLVWANVMNMAFRIVWSTAFISIFLRRQGTELNLAQVLPRGPTIAAGVATYAVLARMESTFNGGMSDFLKSGSITLVFVVIIALSERVYLLDCYQSIRGKNE